MVKGNADQLINLHLTPVKPVLSVVYLRNSRAITCDRRLDDGIYSHNLLRSELISASLAINADDPALEDLKCYFSQLLMRTKSLSSSWPEARSSMTIALTRS